MVATLELRDSFGKLMMDGGLGQTPRLSYLRIFCKTSSLKSISEDCYHLPMKVEPVKSLGFTERVYRKLHQLVVTQVQGTEGC